MSSMLEQAIADAAALREQAIKNAEQSVLDKYSKQIKEAVDQMLEMGEPPSKVDEIINEVENELMQEEEAAAAAVGASAPEATAPIEALGAYDSRPGTEDLYTRISALVDDLPVDPVDGMINLDLGDFSPEQDEADAADGGLDDSLGGLDDLGMDTPSDDTEGGLDDILGDTGDDMDLQLQEVLDMLSEGSEEVIEEDVEIDYNPILDTLGGNGVGSQHRKADNAAMADVVYSDEEKEEAKEASEDEDDTMGVVNELNETLEFLTNQNNQMESVLSKMEVYLEETLLSNAKLLYQNRTLNDISLNERQKSKIVEAISNAESPKEAKKLHETLKATVGSTPNSKRGPQSLSESVNRRSNLSSMLNSRQNIKESKQSENSFKEKMQKLAGIKK